MGKMRTMHLFAGAGGGILADLILGHTPVVAVEWDAYACQVLRERVEDGWFPEMRVYEGDVRLFDPSEYEGRVDCIHAGFPCQPFSVAGSRKGTEDVRGDLFAEVLRCVEAIRPKYIFLENVPGLLSSQSPTCLCGWPNRWGGVHRDTVEGRDVPFDRGVCWDVAKGASLAKSDEGGIRRDCVHGAVEGNGKMGSLAEMAYRRGKRGEVFAENLPIFDAEKSTGGIGNQAGCDEGGKGVDCGNDCACRNDEEANAQSEHEGAGCPQCGRRLVSGAGLIWYMESVVWSLAAHGYDARWTTIRASECGAPHGRDRWWLLAERREFSPHAEHNGDGWREQFAQGVEGEAGMADSNKFGAIRQGENPVHAGNGGEVFPNGLQTAEGFDAGGNGGATAAPNMGNPQHNGQPTQPQLRSNEASSDQWRQEEPQQAGQPSGTDRPLDVSGIRRSEGGGERTEDVVDTQNIGCERSIEEQDISSEWAERQKTSIKGGSPFGCEYDEWQTEPNLGKLADGMAADTLPDQEFQGWWTQEPEIGRTTNDSTNRAAMLKCLGNGQVPLQAAVAWRLLSQ